MGTNGNRIEATEFKIHPKGIDRLRCKIPNDEGIGVANPSATFRQGHWLKKASDLIGPVTGATDRQLGMSLANKFSLGQSIQVDKRLTVGAAAATVSVGRGSTVSGSFIMRTAINQGGSNVPTDDGGGNTAWTLDTTTGILTWGAGGGSTNLPAVGGFVYITYAYGLVEDDYKFDGKNYRYENDDVTRNAGRVAVITGWARVFTTEWEPGDGGATAYSDSLPLYKHANAKTTRTASGQQIGNVFQLPTGTDRYMGMTLTGGAVT